MHVFVYRSHFQNPIASIFSILYQLTLLYGLGMGRPGVRSGTTNVESGACPYSFTSVCHDHHQYRCHQ